MRDGVAAVDLLAIPLPGNVFRRGTVAVYPNAYRFHELDWLDSPTPPQNGRPGDPLSPPRGRSSSRPAPPAWGIK